MSFQAMVSGSHQPPRNQAWFTFTPGSVTVAENAPSSHGLSLARAAPEHEAARRPAAPPAALPPTAMKFLALNENTASTGAVGPVGEAVFQRRHRQAGVVRVARLERTPAGDLDRQRHVPGRPASPWRTGTARGRWPRESAAGRTTCRRRRCRCPARRTASSPAPGLPARGRPVRLALDADRRERARLVEHLRLVAQRDVRQRARAFQADHARADAAQRKGHAVEVLAGILAVVRTRAPQRSGGRAAAGAARCRRDRLGGLTRPPPARRAAQGRRRHLQEFRRGIDASWSRCSAMTGSLWRRFG